MNKTHFEAMALPNPPPEVPPGLDLVIAKLITVLGWVAIVAGAWWVAVLLMQRFLIRGEEVDLSHRLGRLSGTVAILTGLGWLVLTVAI